MAVTPRKQTGPTIVKVSFGDLGASLGAGLRDFLGAPIYGLFFGAVFALGGLGSIALLTAYGQVWMILPIAIGFPLIGPFAAAGLYEISRRREAGLPLSWKSVLITVFNQRERETSWMAFVVLFIFWVWVYLIRILLALFLGFKLPSSFSAFLEVVVGTPEGLMFLAVGTVVGGVLALLLFSLTIVSMPMLLDTDKDFVTAMITSMKVVTTSPVVMLFWGIMITLLAFLAMAPYFVGLLFVFPILGHATWHLYRRALPRS